MGLVEEARAAGGIAIPGIFCLNDALLPTIGPDGDPELDPLPLDHDAWNGWYVRMLVHRTLVNRRCANDPAEREIQRALCLQPNGIGHLYWLVTFCSIMEPRNDAESVVMPFIVYPRQAELILEIHDTMHTPPGPTASLVCEKSRSVGATWIDASHHCWEWQFSPHFLGWLISKTEDDVDKEGDPNTWMWKFDFLLKSQPAWLLPKGFAWHKHRRRLHLINPETGSAVRGSSTTADAGRSGRVRKASIDEACFNEFFAANWNALAFTTDHRFAYSSPSIRLHPDFYNLTLGINGWTKPRVFRFEWHQVPGRDMAWLKAKRAEMHENDFRAEVLIDYLAGAGEWVYPQTHGRTTGDFPWQAGWPTYWLIDDGQRDETALVCVQRDARRDRWRVIAGYLRAGQPIKYFGYLLLGQPHQAYPWDENALRLMRFIREYGLTSAIYYGDRHGNNRGQSDGRSPFEVLADEPFGIHIITNTLPYENALKHRRERLMDLLPRMDFDARHGAPDVLTALQQSKYPTRRGSSQATTEAADPVHDWTSHYRSCLEYLAINHKFDLGVGMTDSGPMPRNSIGGYHPLRDNPTFHGLAGAHRRSARSGRPLDDDRFGAFDDATGVAI